MELNLFQFEFPGKQNNLIRAFLRRDLLLSILGNKTMTFADYEDTCTKISSVHLLTVKLCLKEYDDLHTNNPLNSSTFIHSKVQTFHKSLHPHDQR